MVLFNHSTHELTAKIVYYGPGLSGKTTNLRALHERLDKGSAGKLLSLATAQDRTIYFDLLPVELGNIKGYGVRFQLCTVPGQVFYNETRKLVLKGVDGIVFVVDSQWSMLSHNLESYQNLRDNLREGGTSLESIPLVVQYNKRDLPGILSIEGLQDSLGFREMPFIEAVASEGRGVVETFKLASKLTFVDLMRRLQRPAGFRAIRADEAALAARPGPPAEPAAEKVAAPARVLFQGPAPITEPVLERVPEPVPVPVSVPASGPFPPPPPAQAADSPFEIGGELPVLPADGVFSDAALAPPPPPPAPPAPPPDVPSLSTRSSALEEAPPAQATIPFQLEDATAPEPAPVPQGTTESEAPTEPEAVARPEVAAAPETGDGDERYLFLERRVAAMEGQIERLLTSLRRAVGETGDKGPSTGSGSTPESKDSGV